MFLLQAGSFLLCHGSIRTSVVSFYVSSFHCRDSLSTFSIPDHEIGESSKQTYSAILNAASFVIFFQTVKHLSRMEVSSWGSQQQWRFSRHRAIPSLRRCFGWPGGLQRSHEDVYGHFVATEDQRWFKKGRINDICIRINIFSKLECST